MIKQIIKKIENQRPIILNSQYVEPSEEFMNKRAIIIGGGSGIGYAIAQDLLKSGAEVIICGRNERKIDNIKSVALDVTDLKNTKEILSGLTNKRIDIVVNSQGICPETKKVEPFTDVTEDTFDLVINTNLKSVYFICTFFCKYFIEKEYEGHILNVCSTEGLKGAIYPYGISKAGVISLTRGLGKKMANSGVVINGIAPGATATAMMNADASKDLRKQYIPSHRMCTPEEISKAAHLLLSDVGKQMCGEVLVMDGAESLH